MPSPAAETSRRSAGRTPSPVIWSIACGVVRRRDCVRRQHPACSWLRNHLIVSIVFHWWCVYATIDVYFDISL
jgi:hypothetical protein